MQIKQNAFHHYIFFMIIGPLSAVENYIIKVT